MRIICALLTTVTFLFISPPAYAAPNSTPGCVAKSEYRHTHDVLKSSQVDALPYSEPPGPPPTITELEKRWGVRNKGQLIDLEIYSSPRTKVYLYKVCGTSKRAVTAMVSKKTGKVGLIAWWRVCKTEGCGLSYTVVGGSDDRLIHAN